MKKQIPSNQAEIDQLDLSNVVEFPETSTYEFRQTMKTHLQNLFLSYGRERVLEYIMETQGLEQSNDRFGRVA